MKKWRRKGKNRKWNTHVVVEDVQLRALLASDPRGSIGSAVPPPYSSVTDFHVLKSMIEALVTPPSPSEMSSTISSVNYYAEYHGHRVTDLERIEDGLRHMMSDTASAAPMIFLAGDSSLDNKYWFHNSSEARNGMERLLTPPVAREDVCHWINVELETRGLRGAAINAAIEESTLGQRACGHLLPQDVFLRDHVRAHDVLVVSVGGNDIALRPAPCTILSILTVLACNTAPCIEATACGSPLPCDDFCCGCGPSLFSSCCACPPGYGYLLHLFGTRIQTYLTNLTSKQRPAKICVCMIYYPDEKSTGSWADPALAALGYNGNPRKLQALIRAVFRDATRKIKVPGCEIVAVPLFAPLNGRNSADYSQRVEPRYGR
jgi:hypothetical protein